jgi:transcriptional regulator with XRE-family HTH domain
MNKRDALRKVIEQLVGEETQAAVAKRASLTETEISLYKMGRRYPLEKNRAKLAKGLRCTVKQLDELEWKYRSSEDSESPKHLGAESERLAKVDPAQITDPHLRQIFEEFSMASHHASALSDGMQTITEKLIAYVVDQTASSAKTRRRKPRRKSP